MKPKTHTQTIDGNIVTILRRPIRERIKLKIMIGNIAGPALLKAAGDIFKARGAGGMEISIRDIDIEALAPAVAELFGRLTPETGDALIDEVIRGVYVNDRDISDPDALEDIAEDNPAIIYKIMAAAVSYHVKDFFLNMTFTGQAGEKSETPEIEPIGSDGGKPKK